MADEIIRSRPYYLSPPQMHNLRAACEPLNAAFDGMCYLVGSALTRPDYRDVDVRLIFDDDAQYIQLFGRELDQRHGHATALWTALVMIVSRDLSAQTRLNVDFQFQARSIVISDDPYYAGERHPLFLNPPVEKRL